jgi:hypothetical protein
MKTGRTATHTSAQTLLRRRRSAYSTLTIMAGLFLAGGCASGPGAWLRKHEPVSGPPASLITFAQIQPSAGLIATERAISVQAILYDASFLAVEGEGQFSLFLYRENDDPSGDIDTPWRWDFSGESLRRTLSQSPLGVGHVFLLPLDASVPSGEKLLLLAVYSQPGLPKLLSKNVLANATPAARYERATARDVTEPRKDGPAKEPPPVESEK